MGETDFDPYTKNSGFNVIPELRPLPSEGKDDSWAGFCFIVIRTVLQQEDRDITFEVAIKSPYLLKAYKDVIQEIAGLSWNSIPLEVLSSSVSLYIHNGFLLARSPTATGLPSRFRDIPNRPQGQDKCIRGRWLCHGKRRRSC